MALYCDHNATAPLVPAARAAMQAAWDQVGNAHSPHRFGRAAAALVREARRELAAWLDCTVPQLCLTSGATEANATVLQGLRSDERPLVIASAVEHPSVRCWADLLVPVHPDGQLDLGALDEILAKHGDRVAVVSVMAANNETGVLSPIDAVHERCRAAGVPLHVDATQLPGRVPLDRLSEVDHLTVSAHKLGGPMGVGALVMRGAPPAPLLRGGPQERGQRAGTTNVAGVVGFASAVRALGRCSPDTRDAVEQAARELGAEVVGEGSPRLPNTSSLLFDVPGELLVMGLDLEGIAASTGSACASGASEPSHVLSAMGLDGQPLRLSFGVDTPAAPVIDALRQVVPRVRAALHGPGDGATPGC